MATDQYPIAPNTNVFEVTQLYRLAFGTVPYFIPHKGSSDVPAKGNSFSIADAPAKATTGAHGSAFYGTDVLGREIYCPVTLNEMLLDYAIIRIEGSINIVSTPLTERKGSVHEVISINDYMIVIRGFIINQTGIDLDEAQMNKYFDLLEIGKSVVLRSVITDRALFGPSDSSDSGDYKVVIQKLSLPEFFGVKNVLKYEIQCMSDFIFNLELA
jgi:hypothetical protein